MHVPVHVQHLTSVIGGQTLVVEVAMNDAIDVFLHRQIRVKDDAKVTNSIKRENVNSTDT